MKNGISQYFPVLSTLQSISRGGKYRIFPPGNTGGGIYVPTLKVRVIYDYVWLKSRR